MVWTKGKNYFIRTITYHLVGKLFKITEKELVLKDAAWIADSGRFAEALRTETFSEVEPYPEGREVIVNRDFIVDACQVKNLQRTTK